MAPRDGHRRLSAGLSDGPHRVRAAYRHERYAGRLDDAAIVRSIATACGPLGACAEYLFNTTAHLDELGIIDRSLRRLCGLVREAQRTAG